MVLKKGTSERENGNIFMRSIAGRRNQHFPHSFQKHLLSSIILAMNILKTLSLGLMSLFFFGSVTLAFDVPKHDGFVTDLANVLSDAQEATLEQMIQSTEDKMTAEIAVLTIQTTNGVDISQYATEVGHTWGVGKADRDNGVMIVIAINDREFFIATGYGAEGILPDIRAKDIGDRNFPDNFRAGDYFSGIKGALNDIDGLSAVGASNFGRSPWST